MKSVLMVAYQFPPEGNAGVYRALRFARNLPAVNWKPKVVSLATNVYERYDPDLLKLVPPSVEVIRIVNRDPWIAIQDWRSKRIQRKLKETPPATVLRIRKIHQAPVRTFIRDTVQKIETWLYHPDRAMGWIQPATNAIIRLSARSKLDAIWASGPPWSSFIVAARSSWRTGIPFVLDFRDSWTMTYTDFETKRPAWAKKLDKRTLRRLLQAARAVVVRSETEAECFWHTCNGALHASKIHIIPNGYEGNISECIVPKGNKCTILYAGSLSSYRWDSLLHAIALLKSTQPELAACLSLQFIGENTEVLAATAAELGISDLVSTSGPLSHDSSARYSEQAHALLLLERPSTMMGHELLAGAKLFGYLKAGRPIIGVLPVGEASKILRRIGVPTIARVDCESEIVAVFTKVLRAWSDGTLDRFVPDRSACAAYSAEIQTAALARALDGQPASEIFKPGSAEIPPSLRDELGQGNCTIRTTTQ